MKKNIILSLLVIGCILTSVVVLADDESDDTTVSENVELTPQERCAHYVNSEDRRTCELTYRYNNIPTVTRPQPPSAPAVSPVPASVQPLQRLPVVVPQFQTPQLQFSAEETNTRGGRSAAESGNEDDDTDVSSTPTPAPAPAPPTAPSKPAPASGMLTKNDFDFSPLNPARGEGLSDYFFNGRNNEDPSPCISLAAQDNPNTPASELSKPPCALDGPNKPRRNREHGPNKPDIVIVTDQRSQQKATHVAKAFFGIPPFSCMNLKIKIFYIDKETLGCEPEKHTKSIMKCSNHATQQVQAIRRQQSAKGAVLVVDWDVYSGGNFSYDKERLAIISTAHIGEGGVHEFMHTIGFDDEYPTRELTPGTARQPVNGGTLMNSTHYGNMPKKWWQDIANFFDIDEPETCEWPR